MFQPITRILTNKSGAFAMQFALMAVPLTVCTGLAIDGGRALLARFELASALDAAALAVGSTLQDGADLDAIAEKFVNHNFRTEHDEPIVLDLVSTQSSVVLKGSVKINTYFMPIVGQPYVNVAAESEVRRGGANVEVALALDITSSMTMGVDRMTPLKAAAKDLIDTVVADSQSPFYSRVAIVPWASAVNVGSLATTLRGAVTGPVNISAATWRDGTAKTIASSATTGWRKNVGGNAISTGAAAVTWRNGTRATASSISKTASRIEFTSSASHGYATGDTVYITNANGSYTSLNTNKYSIESLSATKFALRVLGTSTYVTPPSGSSAATAGYAQRCFNTACEIQVTTTAANAFVASDRIYISGVGSPYAAVNNSAGTTWPVASAPSTSKFILSGSNGPAVTSTTDGTGGTASECFNNECKFVVAASSHGFSNGDFVYITGSTVPSGGSSSGTTIINTAGSTWTIADVTTNTFTLPGNGPTYRDQATGTVQECFTSTCEVKVTAAGHGLSNSQYTQITGVGGMTSLNQSGNTSWQVHNVSGNDFILTSSVGPSYSNYTSGGQSQCLLNGCAKYRYTKSGSGTVIKPISDCVSERIGTEAYTDAAPGTAPLGLYYPAGGYNVCGTGNWIAPLTSHKESLKQHIDDLVVTGSTAGQVGVAWGWYMLSPSWTLWNTFTTDKDDAFTGVTYNAPAAYDAPNTSKVLILMTDGDFNTAHCNGVASSNYAVTSSSDVINCTATNGAPFTQAQTLCDAIDPSADDKMLVFTVGFEISSTGAAADFLRNCASKPEYFFLSEDGTDLQDDFRKIAKEISRLRISR